MIRAGSTRQILLVAVPLLLGALWASELPVHALAPTGAMQSKSTIHCFDGAKAIGDTPKGDGEPVLQRDPSDPGRLLAAWTTKESPGHTPAESPITGWIVLAQRDSQGNWTKKTVGEGLDPWLYFSQSGVAYLSYFKFKGISTTLHVHKVFSDGALGLNIAPSLVVDHPSITVAPKATPSGDHLYLVASTAPAIFSPLKGALIESKNGGASWETQVGFPPSRPSVVQAAPVVASGGDHVLAAWLEYPLFAPTTSTGTLRVAAYDSNVGKFVAVSDIATIEGGVKFPGSITETFGAGALPSLAVVRSGPLAGAAYLAWAQRRGDTSEPSISVAEPDVFVSTSPDGVTWSKPVQVNDDTNARTPQFYPSVAARSDGSVVVAWMDGRDDPAAKSALVYAAVVRADGSVGSNYRITECPSYPEAGGPSSDSLYGDYFNFDASGSSIELIFPQIREPGGDSDVYYRTVK